MKMGKVLTSLNEKRKSVVAVFTTVFMMALVGAASASAAADQATVEAVSGSMKTVQMTALAIVTAVAAVAILLFAAPFAWQYGKKIFKTVAR